MENWMFYIRNEGNLSAPKGFEKAFLVYKFINKEQLFLEDVTNNIWVSDKNLAKRYSYDKASEISLYLFKKEMSFFYFKSFSLKKR